MHNRRKKEENEEKRQGWGKEEGSGEEIQPRNLCQLIVYTGKLLGAADNHGQLLVICVHTRMIRRNYTITTLDVILFRWGLPVHRV